MISELEISTNTKMKDLDGTRVTEKTDGKKPDAARLALQIQRFNLEGGVRVQKIKDECAKLAHDIEILRQHKAI